MRLFVILSTFCAVVVVFPFVASRTILSLGFRRICETLLSFKAEVLLAWVIVSWWGLITSWWGLIASWRGLSASWWRLIVSWLGLIISWLLIVSWLAFRLFDKFKAVRSGKLEISHTKTRKIVKLNSRVVEILHYKITFLKCSCNIIFGFKITFYIRPLHLYQIHSNECMLFNS